MFGQHNSSSQAVPSSPPTAPAAPPEICPTLVPAGTPIPPADEDKMEIEAARSEKKRQRGNLTSAHTRKVRVVDDDDHSDDSSL
jgi:hypothetical protein